MRTRSFGGGCDGGRARWHPLLVRRCALEPNHLLNCRIADLHIPQARSHLDHRSQRVVRALVWLFAREKLRIHRNAVLQVVDAQLRCFAKANRAKMSCNFQPTLMRRINCSLEYGSREKALQMMAQEYGRNIPTRNLHFIMGNMAKRQWQFIVIGLLRSGLDPQEVAKQGSLF